MLGNQKTDQYKLKHLYKTVLDFSGMTKTEITQLTYLLHNDIEQLKLILLIICYSLYVELVPGGGGV